MTTVGLAHLTLAFRLLGDAVSLMVFLSPVPTIYKVYKRKSTEEFKSLLYIVGLFSTMVSIYYTVLKANSLPRITINSIGCFTQSFYICVFLFYAPKRARIQSLALIGLIIVVGFGLIVGLTQFLTCGAERVKIVGWICLVSDLCVVIAPLRVVKQVMETKSVKYMPIIELVALTLYAITWFFYNLLLRDFKAAILYIVGFTFGILQMAIYFVYKNKDPVSNEEVSQV